MQLLESYDDQIVKDRISAISGGKYRVKYLPNPKYPQPWAIQKTTNFNRIVRREPTLMRCLRWVEKSVNPTAPAKERIDRASNGRLFLSRKKYRWVVVDRISKAVVAEGTNKRLLADRIEEDYKKC